jgi:hypothetical protein
VATDLATPWEQIGIVLAEAKRQRLPWNAAWREAMRTLSPERTDGAAHMEIVRAVLGRDRDLMREIAPFWRANYEGREVTLAEFDKMTKLCEQRLDALLEPA